MTRIYTAPPESGTVHLGRTLPSLLDEACGRNPNACAFNSLADGEWTPLSTESFRDQAEGLALGLLESGLTRGDRVLLYMHSDTDFCLADMACLLAGFVNVPIYLTHPLSAVRHILKETEAKAVIVSDEALLEELQPLLAERNPVRTVVLAKRSDSLPEGLERLDLLDFEVLRVRGMAAHGDPSSAVAKLKEAIRPSDLATLIYTSGTTGTPKGVMLSHENLSFNALTAFSGLCGLKRGEEVALSFLPLSHVFARALHYGYMNYGVSVYFSDPEHVGEHLREVQPTLFASVPRVLERAYERILAAGEALHGTKRRLSDWALELARAYRVGEEPTGMYRLQLRLADRLVLSKWRAALGGRVRFVIVGGAALRGDLVNLFAAAGIGVLQGYGLTETSPVITYNRPGYNRPGTVGVPLPGVEVKLSSRGEILTRGPHVMKGYYKNPEATAKTINEGGWLHTGDLGAIDDGFLTITGRIKNLFKLSTGKYVMPQPLESSLEADVLIEHALVVGEGEKFCALLLFVNRDILRLFARKHGLEEESVFASPVLHERVHALIDGANADLPHWSKAKRAALLLEELRVDNGLLTPTLKVRRPQVLAHCREAVDALYGRGDSSGVVLDVDTAHLNAA